MTLWLDLDVVRADWDDGQLSDQMLTAMLEATQIAILDFAPARFADELEALDLPITIVDEETGEESAAAEHFPAQLRVALLMQVREVWRATERDGGVIGAGDIVVRPDDMSNAVKRTLRPRKGKKRLR